MKEVKAVGIPACYKESCIRRYKGNPLIEDLPDILTEDKVFDLFFNIEPVTKYDRSQDCEHRLLMTEALRDILVPVSIHSVIARYIYQMICNGYVNRNPLDPGRKETQNSEESKIEEINSQNYPNKRKQKGSNIPITVMFLGVSGMGKTTCVEQILDYFPQVISHSKYHGRIFTKTQITYLKVSCPVDVTPESFCLAILSALDEALGEKKYSCSCDYLPFGKRRFRGIIKEVINKYSIGMLVIDDINLLLKSNQDAEELKVLFASIIDIWKIPVLFVGTPVAQEFLKSNLTILRRFNSEGLILWERMDYDSEDWDLLINVLWEMQYTKTQTPLTPELSNALYQASQGITSLTISIFRLTQQQVILDEENSDEIITVEAIEKTQKLLFSAYGDLIQAIKDNDFSKMAEYDDVLIDLSNYNLPAPSKLHTSLSNRLLEYQKELNEKENLNLYTILLIKLENNQDMMPHLEKRDFQDIIDDTLINNSPETPASILKGEVLEKALNLERKRLDEELNSKRKEKADEIEKNQRKNQYKEYLTLHSKANQNKQSVYECFKESDLTGYVYDQTS